MDGMAANSVDPGTLTYIFSSLDMQTPALFWLVVWNIFYFSHHIRNFMIPTDFHSIIFQRGGQKPPTTVGRMAVQQLNKCQSRHEPHKVR